MRPLRPVCHGSSVIIHQTGCAFTQKPCFAAPRSSTWFVTCSAHLRSCCGDGTCIALMRHLPRACALLVILLMQGTCSPAAEAGPQLSSGGKLETGAFWAVAHPKAEPSTRTAGQRGRHIAIVHSLEVRVCDVHAALSTRWRSSNGEILQRLWTWKDYHLLPLARFLITLGANSTE